MDLFAFLNPEKPEEERKVIISDRFKNEAGEPQPFVIKPITQEENDRIKRACTKKSKVNGVKVEDFDQALYEKKLIIAATVIPPFENTELCERYGTLDPLEVPGKMLLTGEYARLVEAIAETSGFSANELSEEAKN